jgi:hypothetical protein
MESAAMFFVLGGASAVIIRITVISVALDPGALSGRCERRSAMNPRDIFEYLRRNGPRWQPRARA